MLSKEEGVPCQTGRPDGFVKKTAQNVAKHIFCQNFMHNFYSGKKWPEHLRNLCIFKNNCPK
jgi:hypothetical protein